MKLEVFGCHYSVVAILSLLASTELVVGQRGVVVLNDNVYMTGWTALDVFSLGDPANPQHMGSVDLGGGSSGLAAAGSFAYLGGLGSIHVVQVLDPANPLYVGNLALRNSLAIKSA